MCHLWGQQGDQQETLLGQSRLVPAVFPRASCMWEGHLERGQVLN